MADDGKASTFLRGSRNTRPNGKEATYPPVPTTSDKPRAGSSSFPPSLGPRIDPELFATMLRPPLCRSRSAPNVLEAEVNDDTNKHNNNNDDDGGGGDDAGSDSHGDDAPLPTRMGRVNAAQCRAPAPGTSSRAHSAGLSGEQSAAVSRAARDIVLLLNTAPRGPHRDTQLRVDMSEVARAAAVTASSVAGADDGDGDGGGNGSGNGNSNGHGYGYGYGRDGWTEALCLTIVRVALDLFGMYREPRIGEDTTSGSSSSSSEDDDDDNDAGGCGVGIFGSSKSHGHGRVRVRGGAGAGTPIHRPRLGSVLRIARDKAHLGTLAIPEVARPRWVGGEQRWEDQDPGPAATTTTTSATTASRGRRLDHALDVIKALGTVSLLMPWTLRPLGFEFRRYDDRDQHHQHHQYQHQHHRRSSPTTSFVMSIVEPEPWGIRADCWAATWQANWGDVIPESSLLAYLQELDYAYYWHTPRREPGPGE